MSEIGKKCACFLAQASHDLRQPLQALLIYLDLFETNNFSPKQKELWEKILKTTYSIKQLLNNVVDFSKFECANIRPNLTNVNIGNLLSDLGEEFFILAQKQKIDFKCNICCCTVYTDVLLLERILRNLLSNAFKFTENTVVLCCEDFDDLIKIKVSDNGCGISFEEQKFIFDDFYQGENALLLNNNDGAGLGLAIVKKIAAILNVEINVQSIVGKGSDFILTLKKIC